jgi:hypothetical protein
MDVAGRRRRKLAGKIRREFGLCGGHSFTARNLDYKRSAIADSSKKLCRISCEIESQKRNPPNTQNGTKNYERKGI